MPNKRQLTAPQRLVPVTHCTKGILMIGHRRIVTAGVFTWLTTAGIWAAGMLVPAQIALGQGFPQIVKLTASDAASGDNFGYSVSLSGDTAVVGAWADDGAGFDSGSAYVFVRSGSVWTQQQKLTASDAAAQDFFGYSVSLSGDTALIGAPYDDGAGFDSGSAYVFVRSGGVWTQQQKLTASDAAVGDGFGWSVSLAGGTAIVGAVWDDAPAESSGSAYVFGSGVSDTDDDGLLDSWETQGQGIDVNGDGTIDLDLYALGARPNHKDLFVEIDCMTGHTPTGLTPVVTTFSSAFVPNPDGTTGINLHLQIDETNLPLSSGWLISNWPPQFDTYKNQYFGSPAERGSPNATQILTAKRTAFRYCLYANTSLSGTTGTDGAAGLARDHHADDFLVFKGMINSSQYERLVFIHELGHCLGLGHGGINVDGTPDQINYKPNYISVMNYVHVGSGSLDYSSGTMQAIIENNINENSFIVDPTGTNDGRLAYRANSDPCPSVQGDPIPIGGTAGVAYIIGSQPQDINGDGQLTSGLCADLNFYGPGWAQALTASPCETMNDHNDWNLLLYAPLGPSNPLAGGPPSNPPVELTVAETAVLLELLPGPPCLPDIDESGAVDVDDLIAVILGWGPCPAPPSLCLADIAPMPVNGEVDVDDLIAVILNWGPCR